MVGTIYKSVQLTSKYKKLSLCSRYQTADNAHVTMEISLQGWLCLHPPFKLFKGFCFGLGICRESPGNLYAVIITTIVMMLMMMMMMMINYTPRAFLIDTVFNIMLTFSF